MYFAADSRAQLILISGAAMLYVAGRTAAHALAGHAARPMRRALGHWLAIAATAIAAVLADQPDVALAIVFATSVATLSLVGGGVALMGAADQEPADWPPLIRKTAGLLLPAAMVALLAGFSARLGWLNASFLAGEGVVIWLVWLDPADRQADWREWKIRLAPLLMAVILAAVGAYLAVQGTLLVGSNLDFPAGPVVATTALSPLLVAPLLLDGSMLVARGQAWAASGAQVAIAQLNVCLLLPLIVLLWRLRWGTPLLYPIVNWRVDAVALVVLSAMLLPAAAGRWRPGKLEGVVLLLLYVAYVLTLIAAALRS